MSSDPSVIALRGRRNGAATRRGIFTVAELALRFGEISRTAVLHADQATPENDAEHTVMLAWLAPAIAERMFPDLDTHLVAVFALVHDMPEVLVGDTPTIRITPQQYAAKQARETRAVDELDTMLSPLPWLVRMLRRYETQEELEARLVKLLDKFCPKLVHLIDRGAGLRQAGITRDEFARMAVNQRRQLADYFVDFPGLLALHSELCERVLTELTDWTTP